RVAISRWRPAVDRANAFSIAAASASGSMFELAEPGGGGANVRIAAAPTNAPIPPDTNVMTCMGFLRIETPSTGRRIEAMLIVRRLPCRSHPTRSRKERVLARGERGP